MLSLPGLVEEIPDPTKVEFESFDTEDTRDPGIVLPEAGPVSSATKYLVVLTNLNQDASGSYWNNAYDLEPVHPPLA